MSVAYNANLEELLQQLNKTKDSYIAHIVSLLCSVIYHGSSAIITYSREEDAADIARLISFIGKATCNLLVTVIKKDGSSESPNKNNLIQGIPLDDSIGLKSRATAKETFAPANIFVIDSRNTIFPDEAIEMGLTTNELVTDGQYYEAIFPLMFFYVCPVGSSISPQLLQLFDFCINLDRSLLLDPVLKCTSVLYPNIKEYADSQDNPHEPGSIRNSSSSRRGLSNVFIHGDLRRYIIDVFLKVDGTPQNTSFMDSKQGVYLEKTIKHYAMMRSRLYVIPDDIQSVFPALLTHKLLLSGKTTFEACLNHYTKVLNSIPVPI